MVLAARLQRRWRSPALPNPRSAFGKHSSPVPHARMGQPHQLTGITAGYRLEATSGTKTGFSAVAPSRGVLYNGM